MANITSRINKDGSTAYLIRVFVHEDRSGKQKMKSKTWKPSPDMTKKQIEKELLRQETLFEDTVKNGIGMFDCNVRFVDYAAQFMETAQISPATRTQYNELLKRINIAIGHIKLCKLQAHHLETFYLNLKDPNVKNIGSFAISSKLCAILNAQKLTRDRLSKMANIAPNTAGIAYHGKKVSIETADKISNALNIKTKDLFDVHSITTGLSEKSILHHHRLISAILAKAKRERIIPFNVAAEHMIAPKVQKKEAIYLNDDAARDLVALLLNEKDIRIKTALMLLLYSGLRRGELCGLEWEDINFEKGVIHVLRASQYQEKKGVTEVPTKNLSSRRVVKLPKFMFELLANYKKWWIEHKLKCGDKWAGDKNRLFIQMYGKPIHPMTINVWLRKFITVNNLKHFTPHSLRHTFATLQIAAGVDIRTLQARTGHAQASTLINIYSHALKSAEESATDALENMLNPVKSKINIG